METIVMPKKQFKKVLDDVEILITDVSTLLQQDEIAKRRLAEIRKNPSIGKTEKDLDRYLGKRGVKP